MIDPFIGEIQIFPFGVIPSGWAQCNGQLLAISQNQALFALLGPTYGGDGITTFALPDLRGRVPLGVGAGYPLGKKAGEELHTLSVSELPAHTHPAIASSNPPSSPSPAGANWASIGANSYATSSNASMDSNAIAPAGGGQPHENRSPYLTLNFCIALTGTFPSHGGGNPIDSYVGEIKLFAFNFAPTGWAQCNGQLLTVAQNTALFSLLGFMYGGDGRTTFALPDLQGRAALSFGQGPGLSDRAQGESGGESTVTLDQSGMPQHTHGAAASTNLGDQSSPANTLWATGAGGRGQNFYASGVYVAMSTQAIGSTGGGQPHNNLPPLLVLNYCICLSGLFPSR